MMMVPKIRATATMAPMIPPMEVMLMDAAGEDEDRQRRVGLGGHDYRSSLCEKLLFLRGMTARVRLHVADLISLVDVQMKKPDVSTVIL